MTTTNTGNMPHIIKAANAKSFVEQLNAVSKTLTNRSISYIGLWNEGAVLETTPNWESFEGLKVGEKLETTMSPETLACNPALVKSIHWAGEDIICNGAENLFAYPQAEEIVRAVANFLRTTGTKNVILGGTPMGYGSWILPKNGSPVCLSSFGWGWMLPYEGYFITRDVVGGGAYYLSPENAKNYRYGRQYWTQFYTPPAGGYVASFSHRVRDGYLYATIGAGWKTTVEAWNLQPLTQNKKIVTNTVNVSPEWQANWSTDIVGPVEKGNAVAVGSPNRTGVTFYGMPAPSTYAASPRA